ncbi:Endonuclease/exonuclease/phosphatase [Chytridium lagenaria]|nr:Endonuclease/exonuclease/phosphatase [Chytridium lagenaria]
MALPHLLRPTEVVVVSAELSAKSDSGKNEKVTLAVIESSDGDGSCVFVVRYGRLGPRITEALPILFDFQHSVYQGKPTEGSKTSEFVLSLASQGAEVKLYVFTTEKLQQILAQLKKCVFTARKIKPNDYRTNFPWLQYYVNDYKVLLSPLESFKGHKNPFINSDFTPSSESPKVIKEAYIARQLRERESIFSEVFVGTWNVNGNDVSEDLTPWLISETKPDLYILGFQELDLSTEAYILSDRTKEDEWCNAIEKAIGGHFVKVASKQLVGMLIVAYLLDQHSGRVSEISCESVGTGILGLMGNKGAVGCRFRFYDSYLTFVNSHLAADTNMVDRRNQDFNEIRRRLQFPFASASSPLQPSLAPPAAYGDYKNYLHQNPWVMNPFDMNEKEDAFGVIHPTLANKALTGIFDADHVFWLGDLNYRVPLSDVDAKAMLEDGKLKDLLLYDQLLQEKRLKRAFTDFEESNISFAPSYKFDVGTSRYDTSEKRRAPSWCDRVLWHRNVLHSNDANWISCEWYNTCMELTLSDHKPVSALFKIKVRKIDQHKLDTVTEEINRDLDRLENEAVPVLHMDSNVLEFGSVKYMHPVTKSVYLENTGKVIAYFRIVPKPGEDIAKRPWWESMRVNVTILVNTGPVASTLNFNLDVLEDLVILRTENGRDHFLAVSGEWQPSCFGNDIGALCRLVHPVRNYTIKELCEAYKRKDEEMERVSPVDVAPLITLADSPAERTEMKQLSIPKEIWRLIDFVFRFGMDVNGLFERRGDPRIVDYFRECLDTGADFDIESLLLDAVAEGEVKRNDSIPFTVDEKKAGLLSTDKVLSNDLTALNLATTTHKTPPPISTSLPKQDGPSPHAPIPAGKILPLPTHNLGRSTSIHSAAETLLELLAGLRDPVIPFSLYYRCVQEGYLSFAAAKQVLKGTGGRGMSQAHHNLFVYVVSFLKELTVSHSADDPLTVEKLAKIFSPLLLRPVQPSLASISPHAQPTNLTDKRTSAPLPSNMSIGTRLESIAGGPHGGGTGAFSNEARQRMFLTHFLVAGNEI